MLEGIRKPNVNNRDFLRSYYSHTLFIWAEPGCSAPVSATIQPTKHGSNHLPARKIRRCDRNSWQKIINAYADGRAHMQTGSQMLNTCGKFNRSIWRGDRMKYENEANNVLVHGMRLENYKQFVCVRASAREGDACLQHAIPFSTVLTTCQSRALPAHCAHWSWSGCEWARLQPIYNNRLHWHFVNW